MTEGLVVRLIEMKRERVKGKEGGLSSGIWVLIQREFGLALVG